MTSTPASRRAREMTLMPRSCPSWPTLAVRMRIFRPGPPEASSAVMARRFYRRGAGGRCGQEGPGACGQGGVDGADALGNVVLQRGAARVGAGQGGDEAERDAEVLAVGGELVE